MTNRPYVNYKSKMLGKRIDYDKGAGFQCVDLFKDYLDKVLGIPVGFSGNADEIWANKYRVFDKSRQQIKGTKDLMQGDVIVRGTKTGYHIAVVDHITPTQIFVLEQNGSGKNSGNGLGANAIRVQGYPFRFWTGVRRCLKIFNNLQAERLFIHTKKCVSPIDEKNTKAYETTVRYLI